MESMTSNESDSWNNLNRSIQQGKVPDKQLPMYYDASLDKIKRSDASYVHQQKMTDPYLYLQQHASRPSRGSVTSTSGICAMTSTWQETSVAPTHHPQMSSDQERYSTCPSVDPVQSYTGPVSQNMWYTAPYSSPYPMYGNENIKKSQFGHHEFSCSQTSGILRYNSDNLMQHQHVPKLVPNPHYVRARQNALPFDASITDHYRVAMRSGSDGLPYPSASNPAYPNYYSSPSPLTRHPNAGVTVHSGPMNSQGLPCYPVSPVTPMLGKGKNRSNKSYQCPKCVKVFRRGDHLKRHLLSVHDHEHPYQCGDCGKGFASVAALLKHAKSLHVGNLTKGLMCLRCQLTFTSLEEIESHAISLHVQEDEKYMQIINTSSKQHSCSLCAKTFTSSVNLKRHTQLLHRSKDDSKLLCLECGKSFARMDGLRKHVDKAHNGNPNALPPSDLDNTDNKIHTAPFSECDSRSQSADPDKASPSTPTSNCVQWSCQISLENPLEQTYNEFQNCTMSASTASPKEYVSIVHFQNEASNSNLGPIRMLKDSLPTVLSPIVSSAHLSLPQVLCSGEKISGKLSQDSCTPQLSSRDISNAERGNDFDVMTHHLYGEECDTISVELVESQSVSEVLSKAMKALSEFEYEASGLEDHRILDDCSVPLQIHKSSQNIVTENFGSQNNCRNGIGLHQNKSISPFFQVQESAQQVNVFECDVSTRPRENFLMTLPPLPDSENSGFTPTNQPMVFGATMGPHRLSELHQGGGGGVESPMMIKQYNCVASNQNSAHLETQPEQKFRITKTCRGSSKFILTPEHKLENTHFKINDGQDKTALTCNVCETKYDSIDNLMNHIEGVHLKSNPHECCICKKHFAQAGNVKRHIRFVHLRERPFQCKDCSCTFDRLCYLQRHMRTHLQWNEENQEFNPLKPCVCPECGKRCLTAHHLRGHMQRKHFAKNKQNYSEFLAKYSHLEALGNGPGALTSQKGRRGRKRKNADFGARSLSINREQNKSAIGSSMLPISSSQPLPLSNNQLYHISPHGTCIQDFQRLHASYSTSQKQLNYQNCGALKENGTTKYMISERSLQDSQIKSPCNLPISSHYSNQSSTVNSSPSNLTDSSSSLKRYGIDPSNGTVAVSNSKEMPKIQSSTQRKSYQCLTSKKRLLSFRCPHCLLKWFLSLDMLKSHLALCHKITLKKHICLKCGASYTKCTSLRSHLSNMHKSLKVKTSHVANVSGAKICASVDVHFENTSSDSSHLCRSQFAARINGHGQMTYNPLGSMSFYGYDANSPAMVPSPNVESAYMTASHHVKASMPLIQI